MSKYLTGHFRGKYSGKLVDPLPMQSVQGLYFIHVEPGAKLTQCRWVNTLPEHPLPEPLLHATHLHEADIYFDQVLDPSQKPCRDSLSNLVIAHPVLHSINHTNSYSYGEVEGTFWAEEFVPMPTASTLPKLEKQGKPPELFTAASPIATLPLEIKPKPVFLAERPVTWSWSGWVRVIFLSFIGYWFFSWLLQHRGCQQVQRFSNHDHTPAPDTAQYIPVKTEKDTLRLKNTQITLSVYDWSLEDQDSVRLYLNGALIKDSIPLNKQVYSWLQTDFITGKNELIVESINDGTVGPASPTLEMNDGKNVMVFQARVYKGNPQRYHLMINP